MAINMIQFQKGLSLEAFGKRYGTREQCEEILEKAKWSGGFKCPRCKHDGAYIFRKGGRKIYQCGSCGCQTTLIADTIFEQTKLSLPKWFLAIYFITQSKNSVSSMHLMRLLGVSYHTAWRIRHKLQHVMRIREERQKLSGVIELDDAYLGGENPGGKPGRGSENKVPFVAALSRDENGHPFRVVFSRIEAFRKEVIRNWAEEVLDKKAVVITDGLSCFLGIKDAGIQHEPNTVGYERKSTEMECFLWINTILGNLKRSLSGTFHSFRFRKYAHRYLAEYQYRFNRRSRLSDLPIRCFYACAQTKPNPEKTLRLADSWC